MTLRVQESVARVVARCCVALILVRPTLDRGQALLRRVLELLYVTLFDVEVSDLFARVRIEDTPLSIAAASQIEMCLRRSGF